MILNTLRNSFLTVIFLGLATIGSAQAAGSDNEDSLGTHFGSSPSGDILATLTKAGIFNTLIEAIKGTDLADKLTSDEPMTLFAPTDEAFGLLPRPLIDHLLKPENRSQLTAILKFHVVPGRLSIADIRNKQLSVATQNGQPLVVSGLTPIIHVHGNSHVLKADIETENGIIHVIDKVMVPKK